MPEVIASILAESVSGVLRRGRLASMSGADWLEVRADSLPHDTDPHAILSEVKLPVLVACRTPQDGGRYQGTLEDRRVLLQRWVDAGVAGLDLEQWETWTPESAERLRIRMRSFHNFSGIDDNLPAIRDELLKMGANVAKIAVTAHDLADAAPVLSLMASTDQATHPTVAFAMGDDAWVTRVLACVHGAPFVYGSVGPGMSTAPGQVPVSQLTGVCDVRRFTGSTLIYGVLGNPARDSWGPWLFNRAFRLLAHDAVYLPFGTAHPKATVDMLSRRRLRGLSVTAPHKTALLRGCHEIDEHASLSGAINTLAFRAHGSVSGHNTDVVGVREALSDAGLTGRGENAVVLGGGGAARAAAIGLAQLGLVPILMPRSLESVREFAREHGFRLARLDAEVMHELSPKAVVHATPIGGPAADNGEPESILPDWNIAPGTFVLDMIYQAPETELLKRVAAAGGIAVPGLDMFLSQAREQLYLFTGRRLSRAALREFVGGR
jgi:3-dehydroquinate dehydratase/shikimate dehydrogenase